MVACGVESGLPTVVETNEGWLLSVIRQCLFLVLIAGLAGGGYFGWQKFGPDTGGEALASPGKRKRNPPVVEVAPAQVQQLQTLAEAVGSTRARRAVVITPVASGRVAAVTFQAGQRVAAGAVLVRLDDDIERADVIEAKAKLAEARGALKRARSLKKTSAVSDESVDRLVAALATAQANLQRAERRLNDRTVNAPFAGVVGFTQVEVGARIQDGAMVTTLDELSFIEIEFSLAERLFGAIRTGLKITARANAFPDREFVGQIEAIDSRVDPVGRAFKVRAIVANPDLTLPAGMFMHLTVMLDARQTLTIPEEAVVMDGGLTFAFAVVKANEGQRVERRDLTLGQRGFGYVEVLSGVVADEQVVTRGVQRVRDGGAVQLAGDAAPRARGG